MHLLFKSRKLSHTADRYLLTVIYRENGKGVQRNIIRIGHTTIVPMGGYSCSFISVQFFLLVVKQTSYSRDDRLALLTSKIHRYDNQEPSQGVTNWYCTTAASRYFWGSNISLPCGAQNGFIPKEMELKHQKMRLNKIQGKTGPTGSSC